jgi:serine/threonine protein kinase
MKALTEMSPDSNSFFPKLYDLIVPHGSTADTFDTVFLVMDHVETDLNKVLKLGSAVKIDESHVKNILYNLLCSLNYLASANILHRDLKPGNILMNKYCQVRICDFGLARTLPKSVSRPNSVSPLYLRMSVIN